MSPLRRLARDLRTARRIPLAQLRARARFVALRRRYARNPEQPLDAARDAARRTGPPPLGPMRRDVVAPEGPAAVEARAAAYAGGRFEYLGVARDLGFPPTFDVADASPLWEYQLQYLGSVLDLALTGRGAAARAVLDAWRARHEARWERVAWHPYPASLRLANLVHAASALGSWDALGDGAGELAALHAAYVAAHLEEDVRGNHLLENLRALTLAGRGAAHRAQLATELAEQVLPDGGHFERSAMYHVIVLHDLLQIAAVLPGVCDDAVRRMGAWLATVLCPDDEIPLLGDSARGFAPPARAVLAAAGSGDGAPRAGVTHLADSGVAVLRDATTWALVDVGPICPEYLPAHGQSDTLSFEAWLRGVCVVTDPGLCEYTGPERAWGRSARAHSTLTVDDRDASEVYDSFRVGGRERLTGVAADDRAVRATLEPWGVTARLTRRVALRPGGGLVIEDAAAAPAGSVVRARLHLAPDARVVGFDDDARVARLATPRGAAVVRCTSPLRTEPGRRSPRFGVVEPTTILVAELPAGGAERRLCTELFTEGAA